MSFTIPYEQTETPEVIIGIRERNFSRFVTGLTEYGYLVSFPFDLSSYQRGCIVEESFMQDDRRGLLVYCNHYHEDLPQKYEGSCLEYMVKNNFDLKWFVAAFQYHSNVFNEGEGIIKDICVPGYEWPITKALLNGDQDLLEECMKVEEINSQLTLLRYCPTGIREKDVVMYYLED